MNKLAPGDRRKLPTAIPYDLVGDPQVDVKIGFTDNLLKLISGHPARITIDNRTDITWSHLREERSHTVWVVRPPNEIGPNRGVVLGAKSTWPIFKGTKCTIVWRGQFENEGVTATLSWSAPFTGKPGINGRVWIGENLHPKLKIDTVMFRSHLGGKMADGGFTISYGRQKPLEHRSTTNRMTRILIRER